MRPSEKTTSSRTNGPKDTSPGITVLGFIGVDPGGAMVKVVGSTESCMS